MNIHILRTDSIPILNQVNKIKMLFLQPEKVFFNYPNQIIFIIFFNFTNRVDLKTILTDIKP